MTNFWQLELSWGSNRYQQLIRSMQSNIERSTGMFPSIFFWLLWIFDYNRKSNTLNVKLLIAWTFLRFQPFVELNSRVACSKPWTGFIFHSKKLMLLNIVLWHENHKLQYSKCASNFWQLELWISIADWHSPRYKAAQYIKFWNPGARQLTIIAALLLN